MPPLDPADLAAKSGEAARLLKLLANRHRLLILCLLAERERASVGELADAVGLSQSALSQHLALLRERGTVAFDRDGQTLWYRIADPAVGRILALLYQIYCLEENLS